MSYETTYNCRACGYPIRQDKGHVCGPVYAPGEPFPPSDVTPEKMEKGDYARGLGTRWVQALLLIWFIACLASNHWNAAAGMGVALSITVRAK